MSMATLKFEDLAEGGRYLFEQRGSGLFAGVVREIAHTAVQIRWEDSNNCQWVDRANFIGGPLGGDALLTIREKLKA